MSGLNRMTVASACAVFCAAFAHSDIALFEVEWGIAGRTNPSSKTQRAADLARIAIEENPEVLTERGMVPLGRAIVDLALGADQRHRTGRDWEKLIAGLRFDGFEAVATECAATIKLRLSVNQDETRRRGCNEGRA